MGARLKDIVFDRHEDQLYEDDRAMRLTPYAMAERCLQVEAYKIYRDHKLGDMARLTGMLEEGFKGFHNMDSSELIEEYQEIEDQWYQLEADNELEWEPCEDDPIHALKEKV